jgi:uncharacterized protein (UPF0276 family)
MLLELAPHYPISVHTVGISIGSADGIDPSHLQRLRAFVDAVKPVMVSGHLAWSTSGGTYLNDLLPLPYSADTMEIVARHLDEVQDGLGRPFVVENPSTYVAFTTSTMTELEFLNELVRRTGCHLLCDVSNVYLSAHNMRSAPLPFIEGLPAASVAELHLGGFAAEEDEADPGATLLVDTHGSAITEPVWELYARALTRFGRVPTIIEWDSEIPALDVLVGEAQRADAIVRRTLEVARV